MFNKACFNLNSKIAFSNPEYMSFDELNNMSFSSSSTSSMSFNAKLGPPPSRLPPPPPKTPPVIQHKIKSIRHRLPRPPPPPPPPPPQVPLYQNVNVSPSRLLTDSASIILSDISSSNSSSSNATMIVRKSPPHSINTNSIYEEDEDDVCSIIINDLKEHISPPSLLLRPTMNKMNAPRVINRLSLLNDSNLTSKSNRRRSEPSTSNNSKRMSSLSPIMTSSRADLNSLLINQHILVQNNKKNNLFEIFSEIEEEINNMEPTIIDSPPPPIQTKLLNYNSLPNRNKTNINSNTNSLPRNNQDFVNFKSSQPNNCFTNANYCFIPQSTTTDSNSNSSVDENLISDDSVESSLCSLVLQPPSPFKSPNPIKQVSILNSLNRKNNKKVSFMINTEEQFKENLNQLSTSSTSSSSSCSSISSTGSSEIVNNQVQELDLIKEKIFSKIFSNEDYFVSDLINKIESASASSIPSSCASSTTSSTSSGYKSNQSSGIFQQHLQTHFQTNFTPAKLVKNQSSIELKEFIETNRDRLDRLKIKRNQLIGIDTKVK